MDGLTKEQRSGSGRVMARAVASSWCAEVVSSSASRAREGREEGAHQLPLKEEGRKLAPPSVPHHPESIEGAPREEEQRAAAEEVRWRAPVLLGSPDPRAGG